LIRSGSGLAKVGIKYFSTKFSNLGKYLKFLTQNVLCGSGFVFSFDADPDADI